MIKLEVHSTRLTIRSQEPLTVGLVGAQARFSFSERWKPLGKIAVFRQGNVVKDAALTENTVTVPWEVLQQPGVPLEIGIYGTDPTGKTVIPTLWARTDPVYPAADPVEDPGLEPTPAVWQQALAAVGNLEALETESRSDLVSAINEANRGVYLVTVTWNESGIYTANKTAEELNGAWEAGKALICFLPEYAVLLPMTFADTNVFHFDTIRGDVSYHVQMHFHRDGSVGGTFETVTLSSANTKLPNPQKLTFTGAVEAEYDGSKPLVVEIPSASSAAGGLSITDDAEGNVVITATGSVSITDDGEGNVTIG